MHKIVLFLVFSSSTILGSAQTSKTDLSEYREIAKAPATISSGNVVGRFLDGLIFRYYWATEGLGETDLTYRPSDGARSCEETIRHILDLSELIANAALGKVNEKTNPTEESDLEEIRRLTLQNLSLASEHFKYMSEDSLAETELIFASEDGERRLPVWNLMNGPINDAIYHVGQIVTFRRTTGNPIAQGLSMMHGKAR